MRAIGSAGISTGNIPAGKTLMIRTGGNMFMTGGTAAGAAADAAALLYLSGDAEVIVGGGTGILRVEGGFGPFFRHSIRGCSIRMPACFT